MRQVLMAMLSVLPGMICAADPVSAHLVPNHHGWGWDGYVLSNGLVTLGIIPAIGGRVMQYDLGGHAFLWVNVAEVGKTYEPSADEPAHDFGGYRMLTEPQVSWRRGLVAGPPAPHLDYGPYTTSIESHDEANAVVLSESPIETLSSWRATGLKFRRHFTLSRGSTHVHIEQSAINTTTQPMLLALADDTQVTGAHEGGNDYEHFWVYFPLSHSSAFGPRGYMAYPGFPATYASAQWRSASEDGWGAVQYLHQSGRIGIDASAGWLCYVDERDSYAYAKRFSTGAHDTFADQGITMAVGTSDQAAVMHLDVFSPLVDLAAKATYTFKEDWYSARIDGPIQAVSDVGLIKHRLSATPTAGGKTIHFSGVYGVFYEGSVALTAIDSAGVRLGLESYYVSPNQPLVLDVDIQAPAHEQARLVLEMLDSDGTNRGILDSVAGVNGTVAADPSVSPKGP